MEYHRYGMSDFENSSPSLLDHVTAMTEDDIARELNRIRRDRVRLEQEKALLDVALAIIRSRDSDLVPGGLASKLEKAAQAATDASANGRRAAPLESPNRKLVLAILREDFDRVWTPKEMHDVLRERGFDAKRDSVRVMLQRLTKDHLARRPQDGHYQASPIHAERLLGDRILEGED
jgi:hypothetical protein